jgi:AraC-like DNA-binding protein
MTKSVIGVYVHYIDDYLQELGIDSRLVFHHAGLAYPNYVKPGQRISLLELAQLVEQVDLFVTMPDFFLQLGKRIPLMAHGNVGMAMFACKNIQALLMLVEKFVPLAFSSLCLSLKNEGDKTSFIIDAQTDFSLLDRSVTEAVLGTMLVNLPRLSGVDIKPQYVSIGYQQPPHYLAYEALLLCPTEFGMAKTELVFSNQQMLLPIQTADTLGGKLLVGQCQEDLKQIEQDSSFSLRITEIVINNLSDSPSITFVASKMQLSERSVRRRLMEEGVSYRDLVKKVRHDKAIYLLEKTSARIDKIAQDLGYKETANFRRSFKERSGLSPRAWRNKLSD